MREEGGERLSECERDKVRDTERQIQRQKERERIREAEREGEKGIFFSFAEGRNLAHMGEPVE